MATYAFVSGVSKYNRDGWRDLWGVENDIESWVTTLSNDIGMPKANMRLLVDDRCTTEGILNRLEWLLSTCGNDDTAIFVFCGHGAQVGLRNNSGEVDSVSESIVPYDFDWDNPLTDKLLAQQISKSKISNCGFICVFDCCHSGGLARGNNFNINSLEYHREIRPPRDIAFRTEAAKAQGIQPSTINKYLENYASCLFACREDEKAWETWINGQFRGIFSYALEQAIKAGIYTLGSLIEAASVTIKDRGFVEHKAQNPVCNNHEVSIKNTTEENK